MIFVHKYFIHLRKLVNLKSYLIVILKIVVWYKIVLNFKLIFILFILHLFMNAEWMPRTLIFILKFIKDLFFLQKLTLYLKDSKHKLHWFFNLTWINFFQILLNLLVFGYCFVLSIHSESIKFDRNR
jgi:hypothetical protein